MRSGSSGGGSNSSRSGSGSGQISLWTTRTRCNYSHQIASIEVKVLFHYLFVCLFKSDHDCFYFLLILHIVQH